MLPEEEENRLGQVDRRATPDRRGDDLPPEYAGMVPLL